MRLMGEKYEISRGFDWSKIEIFNLDLILFEVLFSEIQPDQEAFEYLEVALLSFLLLPKISTYQFSQDS